MKHRLSARLAITWALLSCSPTFLPAAVITWSSVFDDTGPADVQTNEWTVVDSATFWTSDLFINGVTFNHYDHTTASAGGIAPYAYGFANGSDITMDADSVYGGITAYASAPATDYDRLVNRAAYFSPSTRYPITLGGLISGQVYRVQLWGPDWNVDWHLFGYSDNASNAVAMHTGGEIAPYNDPPQYAIGGFIADASTQQVIMEGPSYGFTPALALFLVPEPTAAAIWLLLGGIALALACRRA